MGVHEPSEAYRTNVTRRMARDRSGSEYSENMSDATSCSCTTGSVDKCSLRSCTMFQEPFFLHPPGSRPRDGIYINPMSAYINEPPKPKDTESFYLHSPHDLVYTRITRLFANTTEPESHSAESRAHPNHQPNHQSNHQPNHPANGSVPERKDETLTVKVDVHINSNGVIERSPTANGHVGRTEISGREAPEHAYEQICVRQDEPGSVGSTGHKKSPDNASESSRSRKPDRRYSRSSSASESSNMSSEIHCFSSSTSTPSLSRNSSNERINKKINAELLQEKKDATNGQVESEKETNKSSNSGPGFAKPPPPPPPPPPPDKEDTGSTSKQGGDENKDGTVGEVRPENVSTPPAANKSDASCAEHHHQPEVAPASPSADTEETKPNQTSHLVNKHMVLPFIPPKFANADSNTLLKPSEYLKSICKAPSKNTLSKARSVDNLDIQGIEIEERTNPEEKCSPPEPPPPPLSPLQKPRQPQEGGTSVETESPRAHQPLATISIQDLTSIQLRRTSTKMNATKTFSAPPPRSVSMTNVSEPFFVQKTDLIAELKRTKDIPGIKKLKVERAQVEKTHEQHLMSEISKAFSPSNFVDQIPEKDSSGNVIPIWKRQMLARKAAERAKKELEEQIARENEERRQKAIPPWKRQLLAKKDEKNEEKRLNQTQTTTSSTTTTAKLEVPLATAKRDASPAARPISVNQRTEEKNEPEEKKSETQDEDDNDTQIIPWRAQLRKTNSKLNILD